MSNKDFFQYFIDGLNKSGQYALSLHFQKQMMMEQFAHSKEMQKMKEEITNDVLNRISITIGMNLLNWPNVFNGEHLNIVKLIYQDLFFNN